MHLPTKQNTPHRRGSLQLLLAARGKVSMPVWEAYEMRLARGACLEVDDDQEDDNGGHELGDVGEGAAVEGLLQRPHLQATT